MLVAHRRTPDCIMRFIDARRSSNGAARNVWLMLVRRQILPNRSTVALKFCHRWRPANRVGYLSFKEPAGVRTVVSCRIRAWRGVTSSSFGSVVVLPGGRLWVVDRLCRNALTARDAQRRTYDIPVCVLRLVWRRNDGMVSPEAIFVCAIALSGGEAIHHVPAS